MSTKRSANDDCMEQSASDVSIDDLRKWLVPAVDTNRIYSPYSDLTRISAPMRESSAYVQRMNDSQVLEAAEEQIANLERYIKEVKALLFVARDK